MKRGEVWWVEFDPSIGTEIKKTRPAIIISNDSANRHLSRVVVVPVTSNIERIYPSEFLVSINGGQNKGMSDQIMAADKTRLKSRVGVLSQKDMLAMEDAIKLHLSFSK
jgi:mRNA interferase MazF